MMAATAARGLDAEGVSSGRLSLGLGLGLGYVSWVVVAYLSLATALLFRGGPLMQLAGVAVVNGNGTPASRWRVFWRYCIAIMPLNFICALSCGGAPWRSESVGSGFFHLVVISCLIGLISLHVILAVISLLMPKRSLQDRLAGTWLVLK